MHTPNPADVDPAWLPLEAFRSIGSRRSLVCGEGTLVDTVHAELTGACRRYGGSVRHREAGTPVDETEAYDLVLALTGTAHLPGPAVAVREEAAAVPDAVDISAVTDGVDGTKSGSGSLGDEGFLLARRDDVTVLLADAPAGLLYGLFHLVRLGESVFAADRPVERHLPAMRQRILDHWDNVDIHPVMGQVERGYAGGSLFWDDGVLRSDLTRVSDYARLLAACGVNAVTLNNVNVHATEARLLTDRLGDVVTLAELFRPYGIRVHLTINFAAPIALGGLPTADPLDENVRWWWAETTRRVYQAIPDFGGYLVKADSEGQPGPFTYGRSHPDGANMLAEALAPFGGVVRWRAFVYNHRQDWRDRSTDRARAAFDHFAPLDGAFRENAILQVKYGPMDFQVREPLSPVIAAMPATRLAVEFQATQEYTGQQWHVCYLGPLWSEVLAFRPWGEGGRDVADVVVGRDSPDRVGDDGAGSGEGVRSVAEGGGLVAVSNVGDDPFWTGHPLAQANLYAFGRLAWAPSLDPVAILDEWIDLTFLPSTTAEPELLRRTLHDMMDDSRRTYEQYTAPLGVGFMVRPHHHYGPDVDGYEYAPWGTYHFADRDGVGVDRTRATGTGFTGQYPAPWSEIYESSERCPDELLLFFHHVPYQHVLRNGSTVIQHIYDTHFAGVERVAELRSWWDKITLAGLVAAPRAARVRDRLDEQLRCAQQWRDQINTYFFRKSGVPDAHGRRIY